MMALQTGRTKAVFKTIDVNERYEQSALEPETQWETVNVKKATQGMVVHKAGLELAPLDGVVPHPGVASLRFETLGASFGQRVVACAQRGARLRVAATDDRGDVA